MDKFVILQFDFDKVSKEHRFYSPKVVYYGNKLMIWFDNANKDKFIIMHDKANEDGNVLSFFIIYNFKQQ